MRMMTICQYVQTTNKLCHPHYKRSCQLERLKSSLLSTITALINEQEQHLSELKCTRRRLRKDNNHYQTVFGERQQLVGKSKGDKAMSLGAESSRDRTITRGPLSKLSNEEVWSSVSGSS
ncbi:hypothetical protein J6590_029647 [Homalodisca vitripennis]|nr:hypothetical protein J6590_029647 [Homalodisca vitripennis]